MGIVVITIPGEDKRAFANALHKKTGGKVDLVIIQQVRNNNHSLLSSLKRLYKTAGLLHLPQELWYALLLKLNKRAQRVLEYFREHNESNSVEKDYLPETMETFSANSDEVYDTLKKLSPDLLVIWGNTIIKPQIIKTAGKVINLHMGLCPYYHGAIANQYAVIARHPRRIGATIHYAEEKVDSGDILSIIKADTSKPPIELFRELNKRARERYVDIAHRLLNGENLPRQRQDLSLSENFLLKNWTPKTRYKLARQIINWEKTGVLR